MIDRSRNIGWAVGLLAHSMLLLILRWLSNTIAQGQVWGIAFLFCLVVARLIKHFAVFSGQIAARAIEFFSILSGISAVIMLFSPLLARSS